MLAFLTVLFVVWCIVVGVLAACSASAYSKATPEQREKCNAQFRKAADQWNDGIQKWNEERRQARAYKRKRNAVLWEVAGKFFDKL
jgi:uncharacterized coiled-coil DUF342 family protein